MFLCVKRKEKEFNDRFYQNSLIKSGTTNK